MTFNYDYMPQARRITHTNNARLGFLSIMKHLRVLADDPDSPYHGVQVLPHLDHADPVRDKWALTEGTEYLASVMFDAQRYPLEENIDLTTEYVKKYGRNILIEGIMDDLSVFHAHEKINEDVTDDYPERADKYLKKQKWIFSLQIWGLNNNLRVSAKTFT